LLDHHPALLRPAPGAEDTPILLATYHSAQEITALLLERQTELNLFEAAAVGDTARVAQLLDADPAAVNSYSHDGWTPLHLAAHFGREETAALLLARGAAVGARSRNAMTNLPLHAALAGRRARLAELLIDAGSDMNAKDSYGLTALHHLAYFGDPALAAPMLAAGGRLDALDKDGHTPLALAVAKGHESLATALRQHGAT
jgi:ankyrin repeat protein